MTPCATPPCLADAVVAAIKRATGARPTPLPLHEPEFHEREWDYVRECLDTGWVSSVGSFVDRFEGMLSEITGAAHVVATVNGTAALHVALRLAGVRSGDEVLVPALTFVATANAVAYTGAVPHFIDSEEQTLGVDPGALADHLRAVAHIENGVAINRRSGRPIRALLCVHVFGHGPDVEALLEIANRYRLVLVEDAAAALGSLCKGRHAGTLGRIGVLSFNGNKIVTTGGGGAILTNDAELARRARHLTTTARRTEGFDIAHDTVGYNYRLPNLNAALGCAQLERLDDFVVRKRRLAERYREAFAEVAGCRLVEERPGNRSNYWLNALLLARGEQRDTVLERSNAAGYGTRPAWTPMHLLPMYRDCPRAELGVAEDLHRRLVCLPSSACLAGAVR